MASGLAISFRSDRKVMIFSLLHEPVAINKAPIIIKAAVVEVFFMG